VLRTVGECLLPSPEAGLALLREGAALATPAPTAQAEVCQQAFHLTQLPAIFVGDLDGYFNAFRKRQAFEAWRYFGDCVAHHQPDFSQGVKERFALAASIEESAAEAALAESPACAEQTGQQHRAVHADGLGRRARHQRHAVTGVTGCPQITLPLLRDARGLVGLSLLGPPGSDLARLALAEQPATTLAATDRVS